MQGVLRWYLWGGGTEVPWVDGLLWAHTSPLQISQDDIVVHLIQCLKQAILCNLLLVGHCEGLEVLFQQPSEAKKEALLLCPAGVGGNYSRNSTP